jgi:hypothetical protein
MRFSGRIPLVQESPPDRNSWSLYLRTVGAKAKRRSSVRCISKQLHANVPPHDCKSILELGDSQRRKLVVVGDVAPHRFAGAPFL